MSLLAAPAFHTGRAPGSQGRMEPMAERGFLVLADISGFTQFVAGTELEHGLRSSRICSRS